MTCRSGITCRLLLLGLVVFTYFVLFPQDFRTLLSPVVLVLDFLQAPILEFLGSVFELSQAISPWLYGLAAVCVAAWSVVRIWGRPGGASS